MPDHHSSGTLLLDKPLDPLEVLAFGSAPYGHQRTGQQARCVAYCHANPPLTNVQS
jgi:hypothetical protein